VHRGYVKLYRKIIDSTIYRNPKLVHLWVHCLVKASYEAYVAHVGLREIRLSRGSSLPGVTGWPRS